MIWYKQSWIWGWTHESKFEFYQTRCNCWTSDHCDVWRANCLKVWSYTGVLDNVSSFRRLSIYQKLEVIQECLMGDLPYSLVFSKYTPNFSQTPLPSSYTATYFKILYGTSCFLYFTSNLSSLMFEPFRSVNFLLVNSHLEYTLEVILTKFCNLYFPTEWQNHMTSHKQ